MATTRQQPDARKISTHYSQPIVAHDTDGVFFL